MVGAVSVRAAVKRGWIRAVLVLCCTLFGGAESYAQGNVLLILDDMGNKESDMQALSLPADVTFSILPKTPYSQQLSYRAQQQGRDVMLHLPMQATTAMRLGPIAFTAEITSQEMAVTLAEAFAAVPDAIGVNNHMGSYFTGDSVAMRRFMRTLQGYDVFFIDSRTSPVSVAGDLARQYDIPTASRHVFLDHFPQPTFIAAQWQQLMRLTQRQALTVVIAHPHAVTLAFLQTQLQEGQPLPFRLVSARKVFAQLVQ